MYYMVRIRTILILTTEKIKNGLIKKDTKDLGEFRVLVEAYLQTGYRLERK
jgi:hypothetical protein